MLGMNYIIRSETEKDFENIHSLIETAFKTAEMSDGDEQDYAVKLRNSEKYIPALALVAEADGKLVGHIMLTRFHVLQNSGNKFNALLVAPLSVAIEYRNQGIGSALMKKGLYLAKKLGYTAAFLCGYPDYYKRFGFVESCSFGISNVNDIPDQYCLACELEPDALKGISGTIDFYG